MLDINGALKAIGYGLLVLFFAVGVVKTCSSLADLKRPEAAFKMFIRFILAKAAVGYGLDLMLAVFKIIQGMVSTIITKSGLSGSSGTTLPQEIIDKINNVGFWDSIPLWAVTLLGGLFITVLSFIMILTVYHQNASQSNEIRKRKIQNSKVRTGRHPHPARLAGWDLSGGEPVLQNLLLYRHQLQHRQQGR